MSNLPPAQLNMNAPAISNGNPTLRLLGYLAILIGSVFVGLAIAVVFYYSSPTVYQSDAKFLVSKSPLAPQSEGLDFSAVTDQRHDVLLPETNIVMAGVHKYGLAHLKSFRDLHVDKVVSLIQKNLTVTQHHDEPSLYEVAFWSKDPQEAQTVVATLMAAYESALRKDVEYALEDHKEIVRKTYDEAIQEYKAAEIKSDEKVLERALQRKTDYEDQWTELKRVEAQHLYSFRTLDPPLRGEPIWPSLPLLLVYGGAGGFVLGMCLVLLWSFLVKLT